MITVSIVNVTSYTGLELLRLLAEHPQFVVTSVTARSAKGSRLADVFPWLGSGGRRGEERRNVAAPLVGAVGVGRAAGPSLANLVITEDAAPTDLAFVCLPHAAAAEAVLTLLERGTRVVDLSADFRLREASVYEEWYRHSHPAPALLESAVYGLCERYRERIEGASLVANPGCYATAAILGLLPAVTAGIIKPDVIIDAKSGISGAGRSPTPGTHYAEVNEDVSAYSLNGHRHLPEITQELEAAARAAGHPLDQALRITFIPHLVPMTRGILATCYADLNSEGTIMDVSTEEILRFAQDDRERRMTVETVEVRSLYEEYYADEPFVQVVDQAPHTKWAYGSNQCFIYPMVDTRTRRLLVIACLDNLVKGAAGQAIQNANRLYGLPETTGLPTVAVYP
jgi:N-acetyl-gamma-glutamyl-phosphate reductase